MTADDVYKMLDQKFEESGASDYENGRGRQVWQLGYLVGKYATAMTEHQLDKELAAKNEEFARMQGHNDGLGHALKVITGEEQC